MQALLHRISYTRDDVELFVSVSKINQQTRELIRVPKTSHKHDNKDLSRLR